MNQQMQMRICWFIIQIINVKIIQTIILSVSHMRKYPRLRMFESRMLNRKFGPYWEKVKGDCKKIA